MIEITEKPLEGYIMAPEPDRAEVAAGIICGCDLIYKDIGGERAEEFHKFVLEVLRSWWL